MRGFYNYNALNIVPCECGSTEPYWHRPSEGISVYCCDKCWSTRVENPDRGAMFECNGCNNLIGYKGYCSSCL